MAMNGLESQIKRVRLVNTSDSDIAAAFISDTSHEAVVTWKPLVSQISKQPGVTNIFNSSQIPGEILDLTVVRTEVLNRKDGSGQKLAKALAGAWYETMALMSAQGSRNRQSAGRHRGRVAGLAGILQGAAQHHAHALHAASGAATRDVAGHEAEDDAGASNSASATGCSERARKSIDDVAIRYPDGTVQGQAGPRAAALRNGVHATRQ